MTIKRCYPVLVGASVAENQQLEGMSSDNWQTVTTNNGTVVFSNGECSYTVVTAGNGYKYGIVRKASATYGVIGHKFLAVIEAKSANTAITIGGDICNVGFTFSGALTTAYKTYEVIVNATGKQPAYFCVRGGSAVDDVINFRNAMLIDLTLLLGSAIADRAYTLEQATAGSGLAWLRSYGFLTDGYKAYNAGAIESVEVTEKVVTGKNLIDVNDDQIIAAYINGSGVISSSTTWSTSPLIMIDPNKSYVLSGLTSHPNTSTDNYRTYDASQNYIGKVGVRVNNYPVQFSADVRYVQFSWKNTEKDTVMFSFADAGDEYEPYKSKTYSLGTDTLRGIFKLDTNNKLYADGDRKTADGMITRKYKILTITSNMITFPSNTYSNIQYAKIAKPTDSTDRTKTSSNCMHTSFPVNAATSNWDYPNKVGYLFGGASHEDYWFGFPSETTLGQAQMTLAGTQLVYELATPTTEQSTPFTSPQIVYPDGTEQFVTENNVPVGHETKYQP